MSTVYKMTETKYSKYFHSLLLFFSETDISKLLEKVSPVLDDSTNFYYNYVQYDDVIRSQKLFDRIFELYTIEQNERVFWCMWMLIHSVPLIMVKNNIFISYFYKTFILSKTDCINCIMHYITYIAELSEEQWESSEYLFSFFVNLHNEINENTEKELKDVENMKQYYQKIIDETLHNFSEELIIHHNLEDMTRLVQMEYSEIISKNIEIKDSCSIYYYNKEEKILLAKFFKNRLNTNVLKEEILEHIKLDTYDYHTYRIKHTPISHSVYDEVLKEYQELTKENAEKEDYFHMFYNTNTHSHQDSFHQEYGTVMILKHNDVNGLFVFNHFDIYFKMEENDLLIFDKSKFHYNVTNCELSKKQYRLALNFI